MVRLEEMTIIIVSMVRGRTDMAATRIDMLDVRADSVVAMSDGI